MKREEAKEKINELIGKYNRIIKEGKFNQYNEANTRRDFIEPLFHHLGWDVYNESKTDEVTEEERVSRGKVDYAFRISGVPKFFLEAKGIREDLDIPKWAEQGINYAWHKDITWAVLSDFEGTKVFNAERIAKHPNESLFFELKWDQYLERFDQLWLLSKESIEKGELDKVAEKWLKKRRKIPVSQKMLSDFIQWRQKLTRSIRKHSKLNKISDEELDESVQRILDRLIFIRISEDREMERDYLLSTLREWKEKPRGKSLSQTLKEIFRDFDKGYNSRIFSPHISEDLAIDDEVLEEIINGLYETKDKTIRYDFSAVGADVLGNIYEQYLGHILKKTPEKTEIIPSKVHRKERGIYYTPTYIVDYIVKNTLGDILKKTKPNKAHKIKVLDPACGSGSFLIRAFDEFIDYYQKHTPGEFGYFRKIEILKNNIYGVDLDKQAVEIAQMNLLLKTLYRRQHLPMLKNIKQGNSLISGGKKELKPYFGDKWQEEYPFNWEEEFSKVFNNEGFDVVIGNPPYVRVDNLRKVDKSYWKKIFTSSQGKYDVYYLFIESVFKWLKHNGMCGLIVPNKFCAANSARNLRSMIINNSSYCSIISVSHLDIFRDAANYPVILILKKGKDIKKIDIGLVQKQNELLNKNFVSYHLQKRSLKILPYQIFPININQKQFDLVIKLLKKNGKCFQFLKISEGLRIPQALEEKNVSDFEVLKQFQFDRWSPIDKDSYVSKKSLEKIVNPKSERYINILKNKIVIAEDALRITATIDDKKRVPQGGVYFGVLIKDIISLKFILGLLNSKLLSFIYNTLFGGMHMGGGYFRYRTQFLEQLPIPVKQIPKTRQRSVIKLVDKMLNLNKELSALGNKITDKRHQIESEIQKTDKQIDNLIYELYNLTEEEIKVVESS